MKNHKVEFKETKKRDTCSCGNDTFTHEVIYLDGMPVDVFFTCTKCRERTGVSINTDYFEYLVRMKVWDTV